jgi:hypothetical protein
MKRRDLLKFVLAAPVIPAALAAPRDFDTAICTARMTYHAPLLPNLPRDYFPPTMEGDFSIEALRYEHVWLPYAAICKDCGATELDVEEGLVPVLCPGPFDEEPGLFGFGEP